MNTESNQTLSITITGQLTMNRKALENFLSEIIAAHVRSEPRKNGPPEVTTDGKLPRLAFTIEETAEILGMSYESVRRLMQRGLLNGSLATRRKLISKMEIERFLTETVSVE